MKTMGDRIRARLAELGKSQHWLAGEVGIKQPSINAIIKGEKAQGSKHVVPIAKALGVHPDWLQAENGSKLLGPGDEVPVVGYVGAGAEVLPFDDYPQGGGLEMVSPPPSEVGTIAVKIVGDSQYPLQDGWLIFYRRLNEGVTEDCLGKLCVVKLNSGVTMLKTLRLGARRGRFRLESWNAPPREDVQLEWASRVLDIRPR